MKMMILMAMKVLGMYIDDDRDGGGDGGDSS